MYCFLYTYCRKVFCFIPLCCCRPSSDTVLEARRCIFLSTLFFSHLHCFCFYPLLMHLLSLLSPHNLPAKFNTQGCIPICTNKLRTKVVDVFNCVRDTFSATFVSVIPFPKYASLFVISSSQKVFVFLMPPSQSICPWYHFQNTFLCSWWGLYNTCFCSWYHLHRNCLCSWCHFLKLCVPDTIFKTCLCVRDKVFTARVPVRGTIFKICICVPDTNFTRYIYIFDVTITVAGVALSV